jgi:AcrR family transcriptional regulator
VQAEPPKHPAPGADRRALILAAAARVLAERGVDEVRLVDVAVAAGVSIGLLQHYFGSREELLAQTFEALIADDLAAWERLAADQHDPSRRLALLLAVCCDGRFDVDDRQGDPLAGFRVWIDHWALAAYRPALRRRSGALYDAWLDAVQDTIALGVARGEFESAAPARDVADRLVALADGLAVRVCLGHFDTARMYDLLVGFARAELGADLA